MRSEKEGGTTSTQNFGFNYPTLGAKQRTGPLNELPFYRDSNLLNFPQFLWMPYSPNEYRSQAGMGRKQIKINLIPWTNPSSLTESTLFTSYLPSSSKWKVRSTHSVIRRRKRKDRLAQCLFTAQIKDYPMHTYSSYSFATAECRTCLPFYKDPNPKKESRNIGLVSWSHLRKCSDLSLKAGLRQG